MASLHVVVSYCLCIIFHIVHSHCRGIGKLRLYKVAVVACGLSLQYVAILKQYEILSILLTQLLDVGAYPCQGASDGFTLDEVVREETSMDISRCNHSYCYLFVLCHNGNRCT